MREDLNAIKTKHEKFLDKHVQDVLESTGLRLPRLKFKVIQPVEIEEFDRLASYDFTNGEIKIAEDRVMNSNYLDPYLCNTVAHELTHHEQKFKYIGVSHIGIR